MRRPKYRLSPNEVERLVKEDQEQKRKLRIIQVREQSKANAAVIRNDVRREKERLLNNFAAVLKVQLETEKEENIRKFEQKYENTLRTIGEGHKEAFKHGDGENRAEKLQKQMQEETAAQERFTQALERQRKEDSVREFEKTKHILARQAALLTEKQRAVEIASLPPPPPDISVELEKTKKRAVPMVDMQAFATTHYHIPDYQVVRAGSQEQLYNARTQAQDSDLKLKQDLEDKARSEHERLERARIRGNEALQKELLKHDYEDMLKDLSLLQKKDRRLRKKMLSQIPKQVFIPPEIYLEEKKEKQHEMERKFHEIYMDHLKMERDKQRQADVSDQIVAHEFEAVSSPQTAATAVSAEDFSISMSRINPALRDLTNHSQPEADSEVRKPDTVLKQLLNRIKEQRDGSGDGQDVPLSSETVPLTTGAAQTAHEATRRPVSGADHQKVTAAVNKAAWVMPREGLEPQAASHMRRSQSQPVGERNLQPDMGVTQPVSENERMIEDLLRRIQLIQSQKEELTQQLKAHTGVCGPLVVDMDGSTMDEEGWTLEEIEIDASTRTDGNMQKDQQTNIPPMAGPAVNVGQSVAGSAWKPPLGSGWGTAVDSHLNAGVGSDFTFGATRDIGVQQQATGLSIDGGSLNVGPVTSAWRPLESWSIPSDVVRTDVALGFSSGPGRDTGAAPQVSAVTGNLNNGPAYSAWKPLGNWSLPGNLRTAVGSGDIPGAGRDAEVQQGGRFLPGYEVGKLDSFDVDRARSVLPPDGDARQIWQNPTSFDRITTSSLGYGTMGSLTDESTSRGQVRFVSNGHGEKEITGQGVRLDHDNDDLMRKVEEYRNRAVERQASMDAGTLKKVREYQHQLLQTYEDKKRYLADIRADIEKRQQELSTTASSKPAFSLESLQVKQSVMDRLAMRTSTGNSQTVPAGQKVLSYREGESNNDGGSSNGRKNIQMYETTRTSLTTSLSAPTTVVEHRSGQVSGTENVCHQVSSHPVVAGQGQEKLCQRSNNSSAEKHNIDTVRKSLSFDEEFMKSGPGSWKDAMDVDTSRCSQALTDDSRLMSSEEERGSPVLPQGHFEMSEKSETLVHDRSYLHGSALLAEAHERKLGFEHRQLELQNQLLDIQRQKDAIMQAYHTGQSALQQREKTLMSKMATASVLLNEDSNGKQREEVRAKLACIRSQIDTDARSRTVPQESRSGIISVDCDLSQESRSYSAASCNVPLHPTESLNESTDVDRTSSRQSLGNCSMPGNMSSDSYLADISFHKIRSDDGRSLPPSAFHVPVPSSASSISVSRSVTTSHQQQPQTWASILSTSADYQLQSLGRPQHSLLNQSLESQNEVSTRNLSSIGHPVLQKAVTSHQEAFDNTRSLTVDVVDSGSKHLLDHQCTSSLMTCGLTNHRPHELSTILEVDTPGSVSAMASGRKLVTLTEPPAASSNTISSLPFSAVPSNTISSLPFQSWNLPQAHSGVQMDVFADPPYTFQETRAAPLGPGAVFHLQPGLKHEDTSSGISRTGLRMESNIPGSQKLTTAKRSLDFSDNLFVSNMPALIQISQYRANNMQAQDGTHLEQDSVDADRTLGQDVSGSEDSSLSITGFSEYLRVQEGSGRTFDDECAGTSALSASISNRDVEGNIGSFAASDDKAADRPEVTSSLPHEHGFDANILERFQQQSQAVFDGVGDSTHEISVVSLVCSSLSCDLEEVSIPEAGHPGDGHQSQAGDGEEGPVGMTADR